MAKPLPLCRYILLICLASLTFHNNFVSSQPLQSEQYLISHLPLKKKTVALFPFKNNTDIPTLQESVPDLLRGALFRTGFFEVVERKRLYRAVWEIAFTDLIKIDDAERSPEGGFSTKTIDIFSRLDLHIFERVAASVHANYAIRGSVIRFGSLIRIEIELLDVKEGKVMDSLFEEVKDAEDIPDAVETFVDTITTICVQTNIKEIAGEIVGGYRGGLLTFETTVSNLKRIAQLTPSSIYATVLLLTLYMEKGIEEETIKTCRTIISTASNLREDLIDAVSSLGVDPYKILADIYEKKEEFREAIGVYNEAIDIIPFNAANYYKGLGAIFIKQGQVKDAINALRHSIGLNPADPFAHYQLAMAYEDGGQSASALEEYKQCLRYSGGAHVEGIPFEEIKRKISGLE